MTCYPGTFQVGVRVRFRVSKPKAGRQAILAVSGRTQKVSEQRLVGRQSPCLTLEDISLVIQNLPYFKS